MTHENDGDAALSHRASEPRHAWGVRVLERLALRGDAFLDARCDAIEPDGEWSLDDMRLNLEAALGGTP